MSTPYSINKILFVSLLIALFACKTDPIVPTPIEGPNISIENPIFVLEDSCRLVPLPPKGPTGEYNDFPDTYLPKTVSHNPENPCEYLTWMTEPNTPSQYYILVDVCKGTAEKLDIFSLNADAFPTWGPNEWFLFVYQKEIWKVKSNGDSLEKVIPNNSDKRYYNLIWNPNDSKSFFFFQELTVFQSDISGTQIDTLKDGFKGYTLSNDGERGLWTEEGSIGYYDWNKKEYIPVSNKYDRDFGGSWHPDGEHFIWLVMENSGSYPISLVEFNIYTKEERVIKEWSCYNRSYLWPKVTQDGKWVYMHLQYAEHLGGRDMFGDWFTAFVNIETGEEYWGAFEPQ